MKYKLLSNKYDSKKGIAYNILKNRGIEDPIHYLHTTEDDINDPQLLDNMREGVIMLVNNIEKNSKTLLVLDSDNDGFCSSAVLLNYLYSIFPEFVLNMNIVFHTGKMHGLSDDITISSDIRFIILPDSSTNDYLQHEELTGKGIDILILD